MGKIITALELAGVGIVGYVLWANREGIKQWFVSTAQGVKSFGDCVSNLPCCLLNIGCKSDLDDSPSGNYTDDSGGTSDRIPPSLLGAGANIHTWQDFLNFLIWNGISVAFIPFGYIVNSFGCK